MSLIGYRHDREMFCIYKGYEGNCLTGGPTGSPGAGVAPKGPWHPKFNSPAYRHWYADCYHFFDDDSGKLDRQWYGIMRNHSWYGNGSNMLHKCENFYTTWWASGKDYYVKCKIETHPTKGPLCVNEGILTEVSETQHYCPNILRVAKEPSTDPDLHHELGPTETSTYPQNYGKWGNWSLDFIETASRIKCASYSWTPLNLTNPRDPNCISYRNELNTASAISYLGAAEQEVDVYNECGDESEWTVTVTGAANLGYVTERPIYGYDAGSGCATTLVAAQAAETWEWPLVKVRDNMLYNYIDSSTYEADDSDGSTQYLLVNGCFGYFSVNDSGVTPMQRSATWPTFDADGNLVASNPC